MNKADLLSRRDNLWVENYKSTKRSFGTPDANRSLLSTRKMCRWHIRDLCCIELPEVLPTNLYTLRNNVLFSARFFETTNKTTDP